MTIFDSDWSDCDLQTPDLETVASGSILITTVVPSLAIDSLDLYYPRTLWI